MCFIIQHFSIISRSDFLIEYSCRQTPATGTDMIVAWWISLCGQSVYSNSFSTQTLSHTSTNIPNRQILYSRFERLSKEICCTNESGSYGWLVGVKRPFSAQILLYHRRPLFAKVPSNKSCMECKFPWTTVSYMKVP